MPDLLTTPPPSLYDRLQDKAAHVPVTLLLIGANLLIFLLMLNAGASLWNSQSGVQLAWGANFGPATQDGQWWRLGSALFLHFGLIHLVMNLWALWDSGQLVERMFGHWRFIMIYLGSGLSGNLLSLVVQGNEAVSGGASGAIFGVYGALLIFVWRERQQLNSHEFRWLFWGGLGFSAVSITLGLIIPGIDNSAHFGGLMAGALLGMLLGRPLTTVNPWHWRDRAFSSALLAGSITLLATHIPPPTYRWSDEVAARQEISQFLSEEVGIQTKWQDIVRQDRERSLSLNQLAERVEREITEYYDESFTQFSQRQLSPSAPSAATIDSLREYTEKRRDTSQALVQQLRAQQQFGPKLPRDQNPGFHKPAPSVP
ncbi:MAG: rhomboid family intramembrane serine protease [Betaproteobacteria bacterium HGW-Betaproteobacteria-10]|nr:MAG: rhomboid family intramembrane serine protease [Betaproteobacteria bacterium HGW-Betaproteobacteria-10]